MRAASADTVRRVGCAVAAFAVAPLILLGIARAAEPSRAPAPQAPPSVLVLNAEVGPGIAGVDGETVVEILLDGLRDSEAWRLVPQRDLRVLVGNERDAELLGKARNCSTEECFAQLAGALRGDVLRTRLTRLDGGIHAFVRVTSARGGVLAAGSASGADGQLADVVRRAGRACRDEWRGARGLSRAEVSPTTSPSPERAGGGAWVERALERVRALVGERSDLPGRLLALTHPTGVGPMITDVRAPKTGSPAVELDLTWTGRLSHKPYLTRVRWELLPTHHLRATVASETSPIPVEPIHRMQLDAFFRDQLFPLVAEPRPGEEAGR